MTIKLQSLYSVHDRSMNMDHWWNDSDRGKPKYLLKNLCICLYAHHKSLFEWTEL